MKEMMSWMAIVSGKPSNTSSIWDTRVKGQALSSFPREARSEACAYATAISVRLLSRNSAKADRLYRLNEYEVGHFRL